MAFTPDGIAPPGIPLIGCSPPTTMRYRTVFGGFTATSGQIILFLFKSNHFLTYFLYMIRYNNMSRPVHDPNDPLRPSLRFPHDPPAQNMGFTTLSPRIDAPG